MFKLPLYTWAGHSLREGWQRYYNESGLSKQVIKHYEASTGWEEITGTPKQVQFSFKL